MRYCVLLLTFLFAGCNSNGSKLSTEELIKMQTEGPDGFNGMRWGSTQSEVAIEMKRLPDTQLENYQLYKSVTVDGINADLDYDYNKTGLYAISHIKTYQVADSSIHKDFIETLEHYKELYGKPVEAKSNKYRWFWPTKQARLYKLPQEIDQFDTTRPPRIVFQIETGYKN